MNSGDRDEDLICAVSTPAGVGGISVIRVSGEGAFAVTRKLASFLPPQPESHRVYHGVLRDPSDDRGIDDVVVACFARGKSFTGEETTEISCHGNPVLCADIIGRLIEQGARPADRGEFTYRAFMNGRLDLVQAESVLALIESRSGAAARLALRQLQGELSKRLTVLEDNLTWCLAHIEAGIDFSTEGLELVDPTDLIDGLVDVEEEIERLASSFQAGRVVREGLKVALVGRPNVGKSSLLNNFLEDERAIVTEIPGTTRDVVEGETIEDGRRYVFADTAGVREAADRVEKLGIERSRRALEEADLVAFVVDATAPWSEDERVLAASIDPARAIVIVNKVDISGENGVKRWAETLGDGKFFKGGTAIPPEMVFFVSALDKTTRARILDRLKTRFDAATAETSAVLSNARHFERLTKALANVRAAQDGLRKGVGAEFVSLELKEALMAVQETLGKRFDDQIMDRVFKEFCIGK